MINIEHNRGLVRYYYEPHQGPRDLLFALVRFSGRSPRYDDKILIETPLNCVLPLEHWYLLGLADGTVFKIKHQDFETYTTYILVPTMETVSFVFPVYEVNHIA